MEHTRIIISDLHVGQQDEFDIFACPGSNKNALFTSFLNYIRDRNDPIELVINGDFVDFLQLRPWNNLSRETALEKIKDIVAKSPTVFSSLGNFLGDARHKLKILPGNHDVELAYPEVGKVLRDAILKSVPKAADRFDLFGPPDSIRTTHTPKINGIQVQIEHGNEGDPFNSLHYTTLFNDAEKGTKEFSYPPGTLLVYDIMNGFKEEFRFVDLLKPEMPAVVLILLALKPFMSALKIPGISIKMLLAAGNLVDTLLRRKFGGMPLGPKPSATITNLKVHPLETLLSETFPEEKPPQLQDLDVFLSGTEIPGVAANQTLGRSFKKVRLWLLSWALQGLARFQKVEQGEDFFKKDYPNNFAAKGARSRLKGDVKVVVFGHTHEALKTEFAEGLYMNSGTWADLVTLPQDGNEPILKWLDMVSNNTFERTAYPTFVRIQPTESGISVGLNLWTNAGEQPLWEKNI